MESLVLYGYGINGERETKYAIEKSGGSADIKHLNSILDNPNTIFEYDMLVLPGGASFGDYIGAGGVFGNKLLLNMKEELGEFVDKDKLVIGIGNGFQVLVKTGLLPDLKFNQTVSLIKNDSGKFENRWVILKVNETNCVFTKDMRYLIAPVGHKEGKFITKDKETLKDLENNNQIVLQYVNEKGRLGGYPYNPDGSVKNITGICDETGRVFGLMPHPEAFNSVYNCPYWVKGAVKKPLGLEIFKNAVEYFE